MEYGDRDTTRSTRGRRAEEVDRWKRRAPPRKTGAGVFHTINVLVFKKERWSQVYTIGREREKEGKQAPRGKGPKQIGVKKKQKKKKKKK